ncbi:leucine-rich repeat domain-containing protein, partial [Klebsiella pneumoniae]|nr:leucine-rich repeat domain-containing protein [Klebsiella pneumoniae]
MLDTNITCIEESAFGDCKRLQRVFFPETLQQIGIDAFESCPIKYVDIPKSVKDLSSSAFFLDYSLKEIEVEDNDVYDTENSVLYENTSKTLML